MAQAQMLQMDALRQVELVSTEVAKTGQKCARSCQGALLRWRNSESTRFLRVIRFSRPFPDGSALMSWRAGRGWRSRSSFSTRRRRSSRRTASTRSGPRARRVALGTLRDAPPAKTRSNISQTGLRKHFSGRCEHPKHSAARRVVPRTSLSFPAAPAPRRRGAATGPRHRRGRGREEAQEGVAQALVQRPPGPGRRRGGVQQARGGPRVRRWGGRSGANGLSTSTRSLPSST